MRVQSGGRDRAPAVWKEPLQQGVWLVGVRGRLDHTSVPALESTLEQLMVAGNTLLVVDFSQASYINSGGLRLLVSVWRRVGREGGGLQLCGLNSRLQEIFEMVGFDQLFEMRPALTDALDSLTASSDG